MKKEALSEALGTIGRSKICLVESTVYSIQKELLKGGEAAWLLSST